MDGFSLGNLLNQLTGQHEQNQKTNTDQGYYCYYHILELMFSIDTIAAIKGFNDF